MKTSNFAHANSTAWNRLHYPVCKTTQTVMKQILLLFCISLCFTSCKTSSKSVKFAIISDIHQDIMHDGEERLQSFLHAAKENNVDFIIELGDFCFPENENKPFLSLWNQYEKDKYHVLGNHDMDKSTKEEYMKFVGMERNYYSFDRGDFHFIILDPNNLYNNNVYTPYAYGNFYVDSKKTDHIDPEQLAWLKNDLAQTSKRCLVFSHQSFENTCQNREEVRAIFEAANKQAGFKKVVAAFSGHDHTNYIKEINGISYIQINSASNQWVGDKYACPERFSDDINKHRPAVKYTVPYKDALFAIVKVNKKGLELKGRESSFIPPTPADLKIPETRYPFPLVPWIKDATIKF